MSIQRGINQLLYTTAIASRYSNIGKSIQAKRADVAERARIGKMEQSLPKSVRAGSAAGKAKTAALGEISDYKRKLYEKDPSRENFIAYSTSLGDYNKAIEKQQIAMQRAKQQMLARETQKANYRKFMQWLKEKNPEEAQVIKGLSLKDRRGIADYMQSPQFAGPNLEGLSPIAVKSIYEQTKENT